MEFIPLDPLPIPPIRQVNVLAHTKQIKTMCFCRYILDVWQNKYLTQNIDKTNI